MKSAEELFRKHHHKHYYRNTAVINLRGFTQALSEHDSEIISLIDEMIKDREEKRKTICGSYEERKIQREELNSEIFALTELKQKLSVPSKGTHLELLMEGNTIIKAGFNL